MRAIITSCPNLLLGNFFALMNASIFDDPENLSAHISKRPGVYLIDNMHSDMIRRRVKDIGDESLGGEVGLTRSKDPVLPWQRRGQKRTYPPASEINTENTSISTRTRTRTMGHDGEERGVSMKTPGVQSDFLRVLESSISQHVAARDQDRDDLNSTFYTSMEGESLLALGLFLQNLVHQTMMDSIDTHQ